MTFAIADEDEQSCLFQEFGFDDSKEVNVGIIGPKERQYPMEPTEDFNLDEVETFLKIFMKGVFALCTMSFVFVHDVALCMVYVSLFIHNIRNLVLVGTWVPGRLYGL